MIFKAFVCALIVYLITKFLSITKARPLQESPPVRLGEPGYDLRKLSAPKASGTKLEILRYFMTESVLGTYLARILLNGNKLGKIVFNLA